MNYQKHVKKSTFLLAFVLSCQLQVQATYAQDKKPSASYNFASLDKVIAEQLSTRNSSGVSLAIIQDEQIIYQKAHGKTKIDNKQNDLTPQHLFRTASTLKMMVGAALTELHFRGEFNLFAPIVNYIPEIDASLARVTTHQLLTHTSGILDEHSDSGSFDDDALKKYVLSLGSKELFLSPGTAFSYSNPGYSLAGHVLESVTKQTFEQAMSALILTPLQMTRSTFSLSQAKELGMAFPHSGKGESLSSMPPSETGLSAAPSGTMLSTSLDYANFLIAILNNGRFEGKQVFLEQTVDALSRSYIKEHDLVTSYGYSYGFMVGQVRGDKALFHTGGMPGYASNVMIVPEKDVALVLLTNGRSLDRNKIIVEALSSVYSLPEKGQGLKDPTEADLLSKEEAILISGTYKQRDDLPKIKIVHKENKAILTNRGVDYTLYHYDKEKYIGVTDTGFKQLFKVGKNEKQKPSYVQWWIRAFAKS